MVGVRSPPQNTLGTREQRAEGRAHAGDTRGSVPGRRRGARDPRPCHPRGAGSPSPGWALPPRSEGRESSERGWGGPHRPPCPPSTELGAQLAPHSPPSPTGGTPGAGGARAGGPGPTRRPGPPGGSCEGKECAAFPARPLRHNWFQFGGEEEEEKGGTPRCPLHPGGPAPPQTPRGSRRARRGSSHGRAAGGCRCCSGDTDGDGDTPWGHAGRATDTGHGWDTGDTQGWRQREPRRGLCPVGVGSGGPWGSQGWPQAMAALGDPPLLPQTQRR